ncbi:amino acid kinase family protein [Paludisphaera mucosa]|uniref:Uridylate kinase n=1 Tax=Paludisphaera mucosa TaxID=3030827 RepID=A0ABT6FFN9_9BACT|nr:uridylate kinase [Paludisphaera mucosa]MDG3006391.1 uridylate kinase [Paludisphaera mucosa]
MSSKAEESPVIVVKVGGSLLDWPGLRASLAAFLTSDLLLERRSPRLVLIAGGGAAADSVRTLDAAHGLGERLAHHLALRAMDLTAEVLGGLVAKSRVVDDFAGLDAAWREGVRPILAPRRHLEEVDERGDDPLPISWRTTSDAIAARVAVRLGAARLILLKSAPCVSTTRRAAAESGLVDPVFPSAAEGLGRVEFVAFREPVWELRLVPS